MDIRTKNNRLKGLQIYLITLAFTALSIFSQLIPLETSQHFEQIFSISSVNFVYLCSIFFIPYSLLQLPGGMLFDRFGLKYILPLAIIIALAGITIFWYSVNPIMLVCGRILNGAGCAVAYISGVYAAAQFFSPKKLPLLIGLIEASSTLGSLLAARPLEILLNSLGWYKAGLLITAFAIILSCLAILFVKGLEEKKGNNLIPMRQALIHALKLLKNKKLRYICFYSFCTWLVIMSFAGYWLKDYLIIMHRYSESKALNLIEVYWGSFLTASLIIGYFVNESKTAKVAIWLLAVLGFAVYALMSLPFIFNYTTIILVMAAGGISASGVIIAFSMIPKLVAPENCGTAVALNNTFIVLGGYVGQVLFATVVKHVDINNYLHIIHDSNIDPYYYSALLIYLLFTFLGVVFIIRAIRN